MPFGNAEEVGFQSRETVVDINLGHKPEPGGLGCRPNETKLWAQFHHQALRMLHLNVVELLAEMCQGMNDFTAI